MFKKSTYLLSLTACAMIVVSGCGNRQAADNQRNNVQAVSPNASVSPNAGASPSPAPVSTPAPATAEQEKQIRVYYGNENADGLIEKPAKITYTTASSKYMHALNALKKSDDPKAVPLFADFTFKTAVMKDGSLTVDMTMQESGQLGANGEDLLMQAFQKTLFQFEEVKSIELLVDGQKKDSLMGHVDLPHPIKRP